MERIVAIIVSFSSSSFNAFDKRSGMRTNIKVREREVSDNLFPTFQKVLKLFITRLKNKGSFIANK